MAKETGRKKVFLVGKTISEHGGRPRHMYCCRKIDPKLLEHDYIGTMLFLLFPYHVERTGILTYHCDGVMYAETVFLWEVDNGTESHTQIRRKFEESRACGETILFVTDSRERAMRVLQDSKNYPQAIWVSLISEVKRDPFGRIWAANRGETKAIPKPSPETPPALSARISP